MEKKIAWVTVGLLVSLAWARGNLPTGTHLCRKTAETITIDGKLDEPVWQKLEPIVLVDLVTGNAPPFSVVGKVTWDDQFLYAGYSMKDDDVWAQCSLRDTIMHWKEKTGYDEGFVKLYIDVGADAREYLEIHVNPLNNIRDLTFSCATSKFTREKFALPWPVKNDKWNCPGLRTAVSINGTLNNPSDVDQGWSVEIAVPFSAITPFAGNRQCPPASGDVWRVFLCRRYRENTDAAKASYHCWPMLGELNTHRVDRWARTVFANAEGSPAPQPGVKNPYSLDWRSLWAQAPATSMQARSMVDFAVKMDMNTLIVQAAQPGGIAMYNSSYLSKPAGIAIDPLQSVITEARKKGISVYAQIPCLTLPSPAYFDAHPQEEQKILPEEEALLGQARLIPERDNIRKGRWLSPSHGLVPYVKQALEEIAQTGVDGIVLDHVGYRNYRGCQSAHALQKGQEFKEWFKKYENGGKVSSDAMILEEYYEQCLADWSLAAIAAIKAKNRKLKIVCGMTDDFDPNPFWANRLAVDYCRWTLSPSAPPYWPTARIQGNAAASAGLLNAIHKNTRSVPVVDVGTKVSTKPEKQLRAEIAIARTRAKGGLIIGPYEVLAAAPALANAVGEEMKTGVRSIKPAKQILANREGPGFLTCSTKPYDGQTIRFRLPGQYRVSLLVYDLQGALAGSVFNGNRQAGLHRIMWQNRHLANGTYLLRLSAHPTHAPGTTLEAHKKIIIGN